MKPVPFAYHQPKTLPEAVKLLGELAPEDGRIIAGGQSLVPMMAFRLARPQHLIDINRIPELGVMTISGGKLRIGATVRHATIEHSSNPDPLVRFLARLAHHIAHPPIRSRGTFCGSIANSDPASEWCLLAATLDADIIASSSRGVRALPAKDFFIGPMTNALTPDEIIIEAHIPLFPGTAHCGFYEVARVSGGFAMAAAIVVYHVEGGRIVAPRIGIGGVEAAPRRIPEAEAVLNGAEVGRIDVERVAEAAAQVINPVDEGSDIEAFKRYLVHTVAGRALHQSLI